MAELGEELRRERVRRNLTFKDIEQVLHIKTTYLEAIEDGNYAVIPGRVYAKGFIRNEIGRQVKLRHTPELIFKIDHSMEYGRHISKIIRDLDIDHEDEE